MIGNIYFFDETNGVLNYGYVLHSSNGGQTWGSLYDEEIDNMFFLDKNYGWINRFGQISGRGDYTNIMEVTTDGGKTFYHFTDKEDEKFNHILSIFFYDKFTGWASGDNGKILKYFPSE